MKPKKLNLQVKCIKNTALRSHFTWAANEYTDYEMTFENITVSKVYDLYANCYTSYESSEYMIINDEGYYLKYPKECFEEYNGENPKQFQAMKFRVESRKQSEEIQNYLFSLGYRWNGDTNGAVKHLDKYGLSTDVYGTIMYLGSKTLFDINTKPEMKLNVSITYELQEVKEEYIEFLGNKMLKSEAIEAAKKLLEENT